MREETWDVSVASVMRVVERVLVGAGYGAYDTLDEPATGMRAGFRITSLVPEPEHTGIGVVQVEHWPPDSASCHYLNAYHAALTGAALSSALSVRVMLGGSCHQAPVLWVSGQYRVSGGQ